MMTVPVYFKRFPFKGDVSAVASAYAGEPYCVLLESGQFDADRGRYSFLSWDPFEVVSSSGPGSLETVRDAFRACPMMSHDVSTPLPAGALGFLSYDCGLYKENISFRTKSNVVVPDVFFGFYDRMVTVDHARGEMILTSTGLPETDSALRQRRALERLRELEEAVDSYLEAGSDIPTSLHFGSDVIPDFQCSLDRDQYLRAVDQVLQAIASGELYQLNLSQRFSLELPSGEQDPFVLYRILQSRAPSPFGCYFHCKDHHVISHSPERFLHLQGRHLATRPMKGTSPRYEDISRDAQSLQELIDSPKEKAELLMITDLLRNDLGRVCEYGSVRVSDARRIEVYDTVYQATSTVEGMALAELDAWDILESCLPGGSITGCPKIRAMQMIEELEPVRRGIYTGVMGYVSFNGDMDFNILIRTMQMINGRVHFHVGGGIVADSDPESEYEETLVKARAIVESLRAYLQWRKVQVEV